MKQSEEVSTYLNQFEGDVYQKLLQIRTLVSDLVPEAEECMKYGIPTFVYHGILVHYAGFKKHIGFYPVPSGIEAFKEELKPYKQGKGSIQFPLSDPLPIGLIRKIVEFRIAENEKEPQKNRSGKSTE